MSLNRPHCIRDGPRDTELSCEGQVRDVDEANAEWYKKDCEEFDGRKSEEKSWSFVVDCCFGSLLCAGTEIQCDSKLLCQASKYQTSADYLLQSLLWHPGHTATFAWCERGITEKPLLRVHLCTRGFTLYCMLRHAAITACALQKMPCYILMSGGGQYFGPFGFIRHHLYGNSLSQGFQNWGTCTPRGTFAYLKGYT